MSKVAYVASCMRSWACQAPLAWKTTIDAHLDISYDIRYRSAESRSVVRCNIKLTAEKD